MNGYPFFRSLALLLAMGMSATAEAEPAEELPPGVIQKGTLANPKLLRDSALGVNAVAGTLGITRIEKAQPYVTQLPEGAPGSRAWKERWIVFQGDKTAAIDICFSEDGAGAANWSIEVPDKAPGPGQDAPADRAAAPQATVDTDQQRSIATAQEFVRLAQAGNISQMIALTSPETIRNSGRQQLQESYRKYVVLRFKAATVRWADAPEPVTDENGNRGWDVVGDAEGTETFSFFISVMREKGRYVVVTLGRRTPDDSAQ